MVFKTKQFFTINVKILAKYPLVSVFFDLVECEPLQTLSAKVDVFVQKNFENELWFAILRGPKKGGC